MEAAVISLNDVDSRLREEERAHAAMRVEVEDTKDDVTEIKEDIKSTKRYVGGIFVALIPIVAQVVINAPWS